MEGDLPIIIAVVSLVVSLVAAFGALRQANAAADGNLALFFTFYSRRYSSAKMVHAIKTLAAWHIANQANDARFEEWLRNKRNNDPEALRINEARRRVSRYYFDVASVHRLGLVPRTFARGLLENNGLNIFYQVCDPMNRINQPTHRFDHLCRTLRSLRSRYGDGSVFDPSRVPNVGEAA